MMEFATTDIELDDDVNDQYDELRWRKYNIFLNGEIVGTVYLKDGMRATEMHLEYI